LRNRPDLAGRIRIHSKAHPMMTVMDSKGIEHQLNASLKALGLGCLEVFYLHQPDVRVPLLETLKACDEQFQKGKFKELGLSNFAAWDVAHAHYLCLKHNFVRPTVYQGIMNAVCRTLEPELMPVVRTFNMRCYVFNPLAAGMLTGRYTNANQKVDKGRFSPEFDLVPASMSKNPLRGKAHLIYRGRYWKEDLFHGLDLIKQATDLAGVPMLSAALRWCLHHSTLRPNFGDGIIFGASSSNQVEQNLLACAGGKLPENVLKSFDEAAQIWKQEPYFRGYDDEGGKSFKYLSKF
jgi:aflatoxin B1 aldehyde reductase